MYRPQESFTINPVDLYTHILFNDFTLMKPPAQTLTVSIFASVTENAAAITPASLTNVSVTGTGATSLLMPMVLLRLSLKMANLP